MSIKKIKLLILLVIILVFLNSITLNIQQKISQKAVHLKIVIPAIHVSLWQELITNFEQEYPNIGIKMVEASDVTNVVRNIYDDSSIQEKKRSNSKSSYDLVYMDIIWVTELAAKGSLVSLSEKLSQKEFQEMQTDFLPKDWEGGFYKNKLYRIPFRSDVGLLFYRKDLLAKAGYQPPNTFTNLIAISKELQKKNPELWGYVWQGMQYEGLVATFVEVLAGYNGFWINARTGEVGLDREPAFKAVKFLHDTIKTKVSSPEVITFTEREANDVFAKGKAVFLRSWPDFWTEANEINSEIKDRFDFVPIVSDEKNQSGACQGGWGLGIASSSKHQKEALIAIKFFTSIKTQRKYALKTGNMPSRHSLYNDLQLIKRYNYYPKLLEISQNSVLRPSIPNYSQAASILQKHLSLILEKQEMIQEEIEREMKDAANETRKLIGVRNN